MLNTAGLRLDQAPPISVPFRFFAAAPLYLAFTGLILLGSDSIPTSRWTPSILASVHLISIGFMTQVMIGSLFQLLPVLSGVNLDNTNRKSLALWLSLNSGTPLMAAGFLTSNYVFLAVGALLVASSLIYFAVSVSTALLRQPAPSHILSGIKAAIAGLAITAGYGMYLTAALNGWIDTESLSQHVDGHATIGLTGWMAALAISISMQLIPFFFLTPELPVWLKKTIIPSLLLLLAIALVLNFCGCSGLHIGTAPAVHAFLYSTGIIVLLIKRRRKLPDPIIPFWYLSLAAVATACLLIIVQHDSDISIALLLIGAGIVLPSGLLLKITPFLCWLHLQNHQMSLGKFIVRVPHIKEFIPSRLVQVELVLFSLLVFTIAANRLGIDTNSAFAGLLFTGAFLLQSAIFLGVIGKYRSTLKKIRESSKSMLHTADSKPSASNNGG